MNILQLIPQEYKSFYEVEDHGHNYNFLWNLGILQLDCPLFDGIARDFSPKNQVLNHNNLWIYQSLLNGDCVSYNL